MSGKKADNQDEEPSAVEAEVPKKPKINPDIDPPRIRCAKCPAILRSGKVEGDLCQSCGGNAAANTSHRREEEARAKEMHAFYKRSR